MVPRFHYSKDHSDIRWEKEIWLSFLLFLIGTIGCDDNLDDDDNDTSPDDEDDGKDDDGNDRRPIEEEECGQGCCSHHGGCAYCVGNRVQCADGDMSPSCTC